MECLGQSRLRWFLILFLILILNFNFFFNLLFNLTRSHRGVSPELVRS